MNDKLRELAAVTDDEIVDAVASYGMFGASTETTWDGECYNDSELNDVCAELRLIDGDSTDEFIDDIKCAIDERFDAIDDRLVNDSEEGTVRISAAEWGRRLAGKSADEIAAALLGQLGHP